MDDVSTPPLDDESQEWTGDELEAMYQQAMETVDFVEAEAGLIDDAEAVEPIDCEQTLDSAEAEPATQPGPQDELPAESLEAGELPDEARVTPEQVVEACLFVGGAPLTTKKICSLFRDEFDRDFVEELIDRLNRRYVNEHRPYEIRLGEGGHRLILKPEFEPIRNRVFGLGPKEVKLSQESLEVLALIAYQQPISKARLEQERPNAGAVLRQLLRRELISLERGETKADVTYSTTSRFLEIFGLNTLDELPRAEELDFK